jgi:hypothetical protein
MHGRAVTLSLLLFATLGSMDSAELSAAGRKAFDHYIDLFETKWKQDLRADRFLWMDGNPREKARAQKGELLIVPRKVLDEGKEIKAPGGMIQDWLGAVFIPNANIGQVRSIMQDYENYKRYFKPKVIESKLLSHHGDEFEVFLRLYEKHILTVVLNTNYAVRYGAIDTGHMYVISHSTRIAEVKNPKRGFNEEEPVGNDTGFLWALNSYWRFEEADGGVYAECEAISLSRDVPFGLGFALKGFLDKFPKESMENTLAGVKSAVRGGTR